MEIKTLSGYSYVKLCRIPKSEIDRLDFALCKQPVETLESYYARQTLKPDVLCNGGLFGLSNGNTYFTFRDEGKGISYMDKYTDGFGITGDKGLRAGRYGKDGISYRDFLCGYPVLVKDGKPYISDVGKELDYKTRRTVLAYDDENVYILVADSPGLNFSQLKTILTDLHVKEAVNMDGGGSTRLLYKGKVQTSAKMANRAVDNVFAVYLKKSVTVTVRPCMLSYGDTGNAVKALQRCLNGWGYDCGEVDGDFGNKTKAAVRKLQTEHGLEVDGVAGTQTWAALTGA